MLSSWGWGEGGPDQPKGRGMSEGGRLMSDQRGGWVWIPIQMERVRLWNDERAWMWGRRVRDSTCPLPPAAGGLTNNGPVARRWHVGGS